MRTRSLRTVVYLAAGLGLIAALFAAAEVLDPGLASVCSVSSSISCSRVLTSGLTSTLGIPDFAWGVGGFVAILVAAGLAEQRPRDRGRAYALLSLTSAGVALALYLLYVEVAQIHAICPVCVTAYVLGGVAWAGAIGLVQRQARAAAKAAAEPHEPAPEADA